MKLRDVVMGANASIYQKLNFKKIKGVFYPKTEVEAQTAINQAREKDLEVIPKGGGSGLSGACTGGNSERLFISSLQMRNIQAISMEGGYADVQAGVTPDELNAKLSRLGLKFFVAPSSKDVATIAGLLSTDGGGADAWINGTMRDNTISVNVLTYDGHKLVIDRKGVKSDNSDLEDRLNRLRVNLNDIASSHGTLGFITEVRVVIKPMTEKKTQGAIIEFDDYDAMGAGLLQTIEQRCPIQYGEAIVMAHDDVRGTLTPPLLILEFPEDYEMSFCSSSVKKISIKELKGMKELRAKIPKLNPKEGVQFALFEDYGLHGKSLERMGHTIEEIDSVLRRHGLIPFAKYGHAPSKWYLGNNESAFGMIMHSREIRPGEKSGKEIFLAVEEIVKTCDRLNVTPKPEHKWPYSDAMKKARITQIREVLGTSFNSFLFEPECASETLASMV